MAEPYRGQALSDRSGKWDGPMAPGEEPVALAGAPLDRIVPPGSWSVSPPSL